ncbi:Sulfite exporter TauE/SafE [Caulifigura coniformis]|uniref:Probable membrane transporter protein n=1 Tax=Caulifigura coniformis TaxID=2527983 RepID=A0A517SIQ9_9PLAN|nr:sulfite exporter TauE/SafE family protein [Caulifigura coniformis]QDT56023.1 Sulfite exporter TauE/SafE [Caulifigura coniformis]
MSSTLLIVAACLAIASFLQGLTGFGFGLTAMGLLPLWLPVRDAQTLCTMVGVVVTSMNIAVARKHFRAQGTLPLLLGSCVGVPLGYQFRTLIPENSVRPWLGAAICLMVVWDVVGRRFRKAPAGDADAPTATATAIGVFSGWLTGAFNIGGPPLVAYLYSRPWPVHRVVAVLSAIFLASGLVRLAVIVADGRIAEPLLTATAVSLLPVLAGIAIGQRCLSRTSPDLLRAAVSVVLFGLGLAFLLSSPGPG